MYTMQLRPFAVAVAVALLKKSEPARRYREAASSTKVKTTVKAVYTEEARAAGIEGTVRVEVVVLADGSVGGDVKVVRSLDAEYGLDEQAVKASKQWTFTPATKDGKPIEFRVAIEQSFKLKSK